MCEHGTMTLVDAPEWAAGTRHHPEKGIAIDSCIADAIAAAWANGVRTLGSCCGHGNGLASVVLTNDPDQPEIASKALPGWQLFQWQLVDVSVVGAPDPETSRTPEPHTDRTLAYSARDVEMLIAEATELTDLEERIVDRYRRWGSANQLVAIIDRLRSPATPSPEGERP